MISIEVVGETGDLVQRLDFELAKEFIRLLPRGEEIDKFCCLPYIDPYGDTVFNRLQMPRFLAELAWLNNRAQTESGREAIARVERLARAVTAEPHLYLKFVGD